MIDLVQEIHDKKRTFKELPNPASGYTSSAHDTTLQKALRVGRKLGVHLPEEITVVTAESQNIYYFSKELSPRVEAAIPEETRFIQGLLIESNHVYIPDVDYPAN